MNKSLILLFTLLWLGNTSIAQPFQIEVKITNQPQNYIVFGSVIGDKFSPIDSTFLYEEKAKFSFAENLSSGIYRLVLGQTTYAKVMGESPQQFDFIYNKENIVLETDFKKPIENLKILKSHENKFWHKFLREEEDFRLKIEELEIEVDYFWSKKDTTLASEKANLYNQIQLERDNYISGIVNENPNLYAAKLISCFKEPILDGYLSANERNNFFKNNYLSHLQFSDEELINSSVYTERIFKYLTSYNKPGLTKKEREQEYITAVDKILLKTAGNERIHEFVLDYLVHGFEVLKLENVINHIAENYSGSTCQTDEFSTIERKLEFQKMKMGDLVSDISLPDIYGDIVTLSSAAKKNNLIIFWASWCPHCLDMLPKIKSLLEQKYSPDLEIFAISLDSNADIWKEKVLDLKMEGWYNISDLKEWESKAALQFNIYATPTMFLINKELKILAKPISIYDLQIELNQLK